MAKTVRKPDVDFHMGDEQLDNCHGRSEKDMVVLHETVSPDYRGLVDIKGVSEFLDNIDFGIHGIIDKNGNLGWADGLRECIFYHTASQGSRGSGNINTRAVGIELVSRVMLDERTNILRFEAWLDRKREIDTAAKTLAWLNKSSDGRIPLKYSEGRSPGVTTHWQITTTFGVPGGHVDCWPHGRGGYFPMGRILNLAQDYRKNGWR